MMSHKSLYLPGRMFSPFLAESHSPFNILTYELNHYEHISYLLVGTWEWDEYGKRVHIVKRTQINSYTIKEKIGKTTTVIPSVTGHMVLAQLYNFLLLLSIPIWTSWCLVVIYMVDEVTQVFIPEGSMPLTVLLMLFLFKHPQNVYGMPTPISAPYE